MPQIDKFIFIDQTVLVLMFFWLFYVLFALYLVPKIVMDLKLNVKLFKDCLNFFVTIYYSVVYLNGLTNFLKGVVTVFTRVIFSFNFSSILFLKTNPKNK